MLASRRLLVFCLASLLLLPSSGTALLARDGANLAPTWGGRAERTRTYDLIHVRISLDFDLEKRRIEGEATNTIAPILGGLREAVFDAEDLTILGAKVDGADALFQTDGKQVIVSLPRPFASGEKLDVAIAYSGSPVNGLHWVGPEPGYPDKPRQVWSQGEDMNNHFWIPTWDYPNDRTSWETLLQCDEALTAVSNGRLVEVSPGRRPGTKLWHYRMDQPNVTYLIAIAIGPWERHADDFRGKPVEYFVNAGVGEATARRAFGQTPDMLAFFERVIGVDYPWDKYAQVAVSEFVVGGMENVSCTLQTDRTLRDERAALDGTSESLVAHELAHQWWGDLLTTRDWANLWLNEGFATYFQVLYAEHLRGTDELRLQMRRQQASFVRSDSRGAPRPMVASGWTRTGDEQSRNVYSKGSSVLHMLRFVLGDEAFFRAIRHYAETCRDRVVDTRDFQIAINEATGQPLDWFFEQWVTGAGYPKFEVRAEWDEAMRTETLRVKQTQESGGAVPVFRMPIDVKFVVDGKRIVQRIWVKEAEETFSFPLPGRPLLVKFDEGGWIPKSLDFERTTDEWITLLERDDDVLGRLDAIEKLGDATDDERVVAALARAVAAKEAHEDVREDAARALGRAKDSRAARGALLAALGDGKPGVRAAAARALGAFEKDDEAYAALESLFASDQSYAVAVGALRGMRGIRGKEAWDDLFAARDVPSDSHRIREAANDLLDEIDPVRALPFLIDEAEYGRPYDTRLRAMSTIARRAKDASDSDRKRIFAVLEKGLDDRYYRAKRAAIGALGTAGAVDSLKRLREIAEKDRDERYRSAAKSAVETLEKAATTAAAEDPQKEIEKLRKRIAELEKRGAAPPREAADVPIQ